jgi:hypothetical protein
LSRRWSPAGAALAVTAGLLTTAPGCHSVRGDEALAMLQVSAAPGLPSFTTARFSVAGRPDIAPHEVPYDGHGTLKFGYYLPGPNGTLRITGQALSASCLAGAGNAEVDVQLGRVSEAVALIIKPLIDPDPSCATAGDAGRGEDGGGKNDGPGTLDAAHDSGGDAVDVAHDSGGDVNDAPAIDATAMDLAGDARDAAGPADAPMDVADVPSPADGGVVADAAPDTAPAMDAKPDLPPDPPPPVCMAATKACPGTAECCSGLVCGTTTLGRVCCGNYNMTCSRPGGEDCCGQLECVSGRCCLPATYACNGGSCCPGLVCGNTTLGRVCCGNAGAPCKRADGADCCGALECVNGVCK